MRFAPCLLHARRNLCLKRGEQNCWEFNIRSSRADSSRQAVGLIREVKSVKDVIEEILTGARTILERLNAMRSK
jgi:hypothetical protein